MAHMITPPRRDRLVAVLDMDGTALSWHADVPAAERAIATAERRFRRRPGTQNAYLPRSVVTAAPDGTYVERLDRYSTYWAPAR